LRTREEIFEKYKILCEFISKCFGENVEVILHDLKDIEHSGIAIYNNHVSGRTVGAPMTNFGLILLEKKKFEETDFVSNYKGLVGGKMIRSSTLFIRDDNNQLIGMVCVNVDITKFVTISKEMDLLSFYGVEQDVFEEKNIVADFPKSIKEMMDSSLSGYLSDIGYDAARLTKEEKKNIIKECEKNGLFSLKGSISQVAETLKISEPTVYRYLNEIKNEG
jgi:predicted transcriptional regulator YheO